MSDTLPATFENENPDININANSVRKSGIELMRVILFFMVVAIHVCGPYFYGHTIVGTVNWQFTNFFDGFSRFAVNAFVITSGYFMFSDSRPMRQIKKLLLAAIPFTLPYLYLVSGDYHTPAKILWHWIDDLLKNGLYFYHMWYIQVMIVVYLLAGALNKAVGNMEKKEHSMLILCTIAISSLIPTVCYLVGYGFVNYRHFTSRAGLFITLYIIGCYIKKYNLKKSKPLKFFCLFLISNLSVVFLTAVYNYKISPLIFFKKLQGINITYPFTGFTGAFYEFNNILVITSAVLFFMTFINMNFSSKIINFIAKKTFGAYVIHIFWIQVLARTSAALNPFTKYDSVMYSLYAALFILLTGVCSITSVAIFDFTVLSIKSLIKKHIKRKATPKTS